MNSKKIIQIVRYILDRSRGSINYMKLMKLLYIVDRESLEKWDITVTGDTYCSMKDGPVLSETLDLIKDKFKNEKQREWNRHFKKDLYDLSVRGNAAPGIDELCQSEIEIIDDVLTRYGGLSEWELVEITHNKKHFQEVEWEKAKKNGSSYKIELRSILSTLGRSEKQIEQILLENKKYDLELKIAKGKC